MTGYLTLLQLTNDAICQRPYYRYKAAESQSMMWQKAEASGAPSLVLFALPNAPSVAGVAGKYGGTPASDLDWKSNHELLSNASEEDIC